jgi:hypothetical protein
MSNFCRAETLSSVCLFVFCYAFHAVQYYYKISAGLDAVIFRGRGEGAGFRHGIILILAVHPIPFQLQLLLSSFTIFSRIRSGNIDSALCFKMVLFAYKDHECTA